MRLRSRFPVFVWLLFCAKSGFSAICDKSSTQQNLTVDPADVIRMAVPPGIFGFDVPWYDFQAGYYRGGKVRDEIVQWLLPFKGGYYRFPGGNYFEWHKTSAAVPLREKIYEEYAGHQVPEFGYLEFLKFLERVDGRGIYMLNLYGTKGHLLPLDKVLNSNAAFFDALNGQSLKRRIDYWELGNELDWRPHNWSAETYISRAKPLVDQILKKDPSAKFILNGYTNPWAAGYSAAKKFNEAVAQHLPVAGISLHAYYDGHSIPIMLEAVANYAKSFQQYSAEGKVFVTEHGRWPSEPAQGPWEQNWYKASGGFGAISAADFTLAVMPVESVGGAMWHDLGVRGPWQLIRLNAKTDQVYPSATYWALRVIRQGFLEDLIGVTPALAKSNDYAGGYDMRFVAMKNREGNFSLLGVNRSKHPKRVSVKMSSAEALQLGKLSYFQSGPNGEDNTDFAQHKHVMQERVLPPQSSEVCIPPLSVFAVAFSVQ
jgi:alpha-L-arabinofuranosidase